MTHHQAENVRVFGTVDNILKRHVLKTVLENGGSMKKSLRPLGLGKVTLYRWFRVWGLSPTDNLEMKTSDRRARLAAIEKALQEITP